MLRILTELENLTEERFEDGPCGSMIDHSNSIIGLKSEYLYWSLERCHPYGAACLSH